MQRVCVGLMTFVTAIGVASAVHAADVTFRHASLLGVRYNELGLGVFSDTGFRRSLFSGDSVLLQGTYLEGGVVTQLSPANLHPGLYVELVPLAVWKTRFSVQKVQYFGVLGSMQSVTPDDWSPERIEANNDAGRYARVGGSTWTLQQTLRAKAGPLVASVVGAWQRFHFDVDGPIYEAVNEVPFAPDDDLLTLKATLGYAVFGQPQTPDSLIVAALFDTLRTDALDVRRQTVAGALLWKPPAELWSTGNPTLAGISGVFLDDRYRTGEPYFAAALAVEFLKPYGAP